MAVAPLFHHVLHHVDPFEMLSSIIPRRARAPRIARFTDSAGRRWEVRELPTRTCSPSRVAGLAFETEGLIRRVRRYPSNWMELGARELEALSQGT